MAENKTSFILYTDLIHTIDHLSDIQSGKLFKHILKYVNDQNPKTDNKLVNICFEPIKQQLKRDLKKFEEIKIQRSDAGKLGMKKRWEKHNKSKQTITNDNTVKQKITNITDSVNVNDSVSDNVNVSEKKENIYLPEFLEFLTYSKTLKPYHESLDFQIETKYNSWKENKWRDYNNKPIKNWKNKISQTMPYFKKDYKTIDRNKPTPFVR